jgi:hypothetical protein
MQQKACEMEPHGGQQHRSSASRMPSSKSTEKSTKNTQKMHGGQQHLSSASRMPSSKSTEKSTKNTQKMHGGQQHLSSASRMPSNTSELLPRKSSALESSNATWIDRRLRDQSVQPDRQDHEYLEVQVEGLADWTDGKAEKWARRRMDGLMDGQTVRRNRRAGGRSHMWLDQRRSTKTDTLSHSVRAAHLTVPASHRQPHTNSPACHS